MGPGGRPPLSLVGAQDCLCPPLLKHFKYDIITEFVNNSHPAVDSHKSKTTVSAIDFTSQHWSL